MIWEDPLTFLCSPNQVTDSLVPIWHQDICDMVLTGWCVSECCIHSRLLFLSLFKLTLFFISYTRTKPLLLGGSFCVPTTFQMKDLLMLNEYVHWLWLDIHMPRFEKQGQFKAICDNFSYNNNLQNLFCGWTSSSETTYLCRRVDDGASSIPPRRPAFVPTSRLHLKPTVHKVILTALFLMWIYWGKNVLKFRSRIYFMPRISFIGINITWTSKLIYQAFLQRYIHTEYI